ncbi:uncharacterized protein LOC115758265 [Drosophila novamexicana]|uniref:uncharacterized protein LOC115758265 n=1 Tax=Drosophila novamexicana TaxID=47314 RepID=UPI0011E5A3F2|nr:uncharacterized protein LOC115758265 [Drosophila novamexicana]
MKLQLIKDICILVYLANIYQIEGKGNCYYFSDQKLSWTKALKACEDNNLCLASFDSAEAFNHLRNQPDELKVDYWFGLNGRERNTFKYIATYELIKYLPPGSELEIDKPCAFVKLLDNKKYTIRSSNCIIKKKFVCFDSVRCKGIIANKETGYLTEVTCKN